MNWLKNEIRIVQRYIGKNGALYASVLMPNPSNKNWMIDYFTIGKALEIVLDRKNLFLPKEICSIKANRIEFEKTNGYA